MQWKMLSGLEHEVRSQLSNTEPKHNIFLNDWMEPDSLREGYFLKSCWVFYWWYFHIHTHVVNGLVSIWFIVSFTSDRRAIHRSALADLAEISARGDHNVPSCTWKGLRWIPGKIEFMFLLPVFFFWAGRQKCSKSTVYRTQVVLPALSPGALLGIPCTW